MLGARRARAASWASGAFPYGVAVASALLALGVVVVLDAVVGSRPNVVLLYVVPVVLAASRCGLGPALLAALVTVVGQDLLLIEPRGTLTIASPDDALGLVLLAFVAVVTAQLAASARRGAQHAREAEVARRSDALKSALLRAVSHDLRTPLASIKANASGLLSEEHASYGVAERREALQAIEDEADHLDRLVGNLLDASKIEAGALQPRKTRQDSAELVRDVVRRQQGRLADHPLTMEIPEALPTVWCDRAQIAQALGNVVENATVHTPPGTPVVVRVARDGRLLRITVDDEGPGIPTAERARLFRPFERGRGIPRGTGLGLAIARGYVEANGGRLVADDAPGGGARLVMTLPLGGEPA